MTTIFSKNLRFLRKQKGWGQDELAKRTNRSQPTIQLWESDKRSPTMEMVTELAKIFNVDVNSLIYKDLETGSFSKDGYATDPNLIPSDITSLEDAMQVIVNNPSVAFYGGYDINKLSDDEKIEFANWIADSIKLYARKFGK